MSPDLPSIIKHAEQLLVEIEKAVRRFARFHKYTYGTKLREQTMELAQLAHRAWRHSDQRGVWLGKLAEAIDDLKLTMQLGSKIHAFVSFAQFESLYRVLAQIGQQCGGWLKQHQKGQNAAPLNGAPQRAQILSTRTASAEANS
jgi:hypothetical protein